MKRETKFERLKRLALAREATWATSTYKLARKLGDPAFDAESVEVRLIMMYADGYERARRDAAAGKREDARKLADLIAWHVRTERSLQDQLDSEKQGAMTLRAQLLAVYQWAQPRGIELPRVPELLNPKPRQRRPVVLSCGHPHSTSGAVVVGQHIQCNMCRGTSHVVCVP